MSHSNEDSNETRELLKLYKKQAATIVDIVLGIYHLNITPVKLVSLVSLDVIPSNDVHRTAHFLSTLGIALHETLNRVSLAAYDDNSMPPNWPLSRDDIIEDQHDLRKRLDATVEISQFIKDIHDRST